MPEPYNNTLTGEFWVVWKKRYRFHDGDEAEWFTHIDYIRPTLEDAEELARGFRMQLSVIDAKITRVTP